MTRGFSTPLLSLTKLRGNLKLRDMPARLDTETFIRRAKEVHGDYYDYSLVEYKNAKTRVKIICPVHGIFVQTPDNHLHNGCSECGRESSKYKLRRTFDEFVSRAREKHGGKFDYSQVEYINSTTKVIILCPIHGEFEQTPREHLSGHGCPKCRGYNVSISKRSTKEKFIYKAQEIHGDKYDYSKVEYINNATKVCITCHKHGDFYQTPANHLRGKGCDRCAHEYVNSLCKDNKESFVRKAKSVHGDKYSYDDVEYTFSWRKVKIVCPIHGYFYQTPAHHLQGCGCPSCNESKGESRISVFLNKMCINYVSQYTIPNEDLFCSNNELRVDFWVKEKNTIIEYHGAQHYKPVELFGGETQLEKQRNRDMALRLYCKEHKIRLIEIPYTQYKEIDKILTQKLG